MLAARPIVWPLTLPMCSPISDGAAAALVCSPEYRAAAGAGRRAVAIRASVMMSGDHRDPDRLDEHVARKASRRAYEQAALGPEDIDVVECHDATAFGEILQSEMLGFFAFGEGGPAAERGETTLGGRIPFNPSGGLESKGHPIGATGLGPSVRDRRAIARRGRRRGRSATPASALSRTAADLRGVEEAAVAITILRRSPLMNLAGLLDAAALSFPDRPAVSVADQRALRLLRPMARSRRGSPAASVRPALRPATASCSR